METISGKIERKEITDGETNGKAWKRATFIINEKKYSTFDTKIIDEFKIGDFVQMLGEQKDQYWNMKSMTKAQAEEEVETVKVSMNAKTNELEFEIRSRQVRVEALKSAIEHSKVREFTSLTEKDMIRMAKDFEKYIVTGE
tara:strand:+ start:2282 stop:2704 length:423 start_codon:yes stop_codon:yes gene_type:complete